MSESGFRAAGRPVGEATAALVRSVQLATEAASDAPGQRWVAASIGPYGATLADGSEYTGAYDLDEQALRSWHRPRIEALAAAGPDVFAIETIPSAVEARAILDACALPVHRSRCGSSAQSSGFPAVWALRLPCGA